MQKKEEKEKQEKQENPENPENLENLESPDADKKLNAVFTTLIMLIKSAIQEL